MAKRAATKVADEPVNTNNSLPLFYRKPVALEPQRHAKAGVLPVVDYSFAKTTNSILLNTTEVYEASKFYPIVFLTADIPLPMAVVGLEGSNYFIDKKSQWKPECYIPAYVRRYPFIFSDSPNFNQFILCVDEEASQFKANGEADAVALFTNGEPTALSKSALNFCSTYETEFQNTKNFCLALKQEELLVPMRTDSKLQSGREIHLAGFQIVDEKKLASLPDAKILELYKKGWLPLLYASIMSNSNWKNLLEMASSLEKANAN